MKSMSPVTRFEVPEERGTTHESLILASAEPPRDPEARIVGANGMVLAEADPDRIVWCFSAVGFVRLGMEAHAEHLQDVREEIGDEMRGERFDAIAERSW